MKNIIIELSQPKSSKTRKRSKILLISLNSPPYIRSSRINIRNERLGNESFSYFLQYKTRKNQNLVTIVSIQQKQRDRDRLNFYAVEKFWKILRKIWKKLNFKNMKIRLKIFFELS